MSPAITKQQPNKIFSNKKDQIPIFKTPILRKSIPLYKNVHHKRFVQIPQKPHFFTVTPTESALFYYTIFAYLLYSSHYQKYALRG